MRTLVVGYKLSHFWKCTGISQENPPEVIAQPIQTDRHTFYQKASAAVSAGKIQFDKFNALVSKANRHGYAAALEELQGIV